MNIIITENQINALSNALMSEEDYSELSDYIDRLRSLLPSDSTNDLNGSSETSTIPISGDFNSIVGLVIDKLEGGYYHPDMLQDGRVKDPRFSKSGETMFGIDRKNGGAINTTSAGQQFWSIIDNANARSNWKWNYKGGSLRPELENLVAQMIKPLYDQFSKRYLSPQALQIVNNDKRLTFNFIYATWNGEGWFKKFANQINNAVSQGITSPQELSNVAIRARTGSGNSLIADTGSKVSGIMSSMA